MSAGRIRKLSSTMAILLACVPPAFGQWKGEGIVAGATHHVNGAAWRDALQRFPDSQCQGSKAGEMVPCEHLRLLVLNESRGPLLCQVEFQRKPVDTGARALRSYWTIVYPGEQREAGSSAGKPFFDASGVSSRCLAVPQVPPPEPAPGSCEMALALAEEADNYYPPGGKRRIEQGVAYFDFRHDSKRLSNFSLVRSSGYSDLDNAALRLLRAAEVSVDGCISGRARRAVSFVMLEENAPEVPGDLPESASAAIRVTAFRAILVN